MSKQRIPKKSSSEILFDKFDFLIKTALVGHSKEDELKEIAGKLKEEFSEKDKELRKAREANKIYNELININEVRNKYLVRELETTRRLTSDCQVMEKRLKSLVK